MGRLTRWEGFDEDGPRAVLVRRDHFPTALQEALRKLARYEDMEETPSVSFADNSLSQPAADSSLMEGADAGEGAKREAGKERTDAEEVYQGRAQDPGGGLQEGARSDHER